MIVIALLAGCGAQLGDQDGAGGGLDAAGGGKPDARESASIDAAPGGSACNNGRVIYLNFDGVTITQAPTDASENKAAWIGVATATVPPYMNGVAGRDTTITQIVDGVRLQLSEFPVTVVTTRPASGSYVMLAFGGTGTDVGTGYGYATGDHDCGDVEHDDLGWVSDTVPTNIIVPISVGVVGWMLGLQGTTDPNDCMCGWANDCQWAGNTCAFGTAVTTTLSASPASTCPGLTTQDEHAAFRTAFCQ